ncbi:MAG: hypothetical protein D8M61_17570 [Ignavibacteriae bacterium]|nr:hypothetical protein [Ignavibacteriota bacterium]
MWFNMRNKIAGVFTKKNLESNQSEYYCKFYSRNDNFEISRITKSTFELYRKNINSLKTKKNNIKNT